MEHKTRTKSVTLDRLTGTYEAICVCSCGWEQGIHESGKLRAGLSAEEMGKEHLANPDAPAVPEAVRRARQPAGGSASARPATITPSLAVWMLTVAIWWGIGLQVVGGCLIGLGASSHGGDFFIWLGVIGAGVGFWLLAAGAGAWAVRVGTIAAGSTAR